MPPAPEVTFHLLATLFEPLVGLKNTCGGHGFISIYLPKPF